MRILIYTHEFPPFLGGLGTTSLNLARGLSKRRNDVLVLAPDYPEKTDGADELYNFDVIRMGKGTRNHGVPSPVKEIRGYLYLRDVIKSHRPDALIAVTREAHAACGFNTAILPDISIARVAGYEALRYLMGKRIKNKIISVPMKKFYSGCQAIVAASSATRELFIKSGLSPDKIQVVYNGVNADMVDSPVDDARIGEIRKRYGIKKDDRVLLSVSRLVKGKGQDMVIKILPKILPRYKGIKYVIAGQGPYQRELLKLAGDLNVEDSVIFTGSVPYDDVKHFYDLSHIFLMPNRSEKSRENVEGLPNVIYEAASRGKPVIAGIPGGAKEIVVSGQTGYIVDGNVSEQIERALTTLLDDPGICEEFGARLKELIMEKYTNRQMIDGYERLLKA